MNTKRTILLLSLIVGLLGASIYWFTTGYAQAQTGEKEEAVLPTWEYAELYVTENPSLKQTQILFLPPNKMPGNSSIFNSGKLDPDQTYFTALDIVGNLGWEMIQVRSTATSAKTFQTIYYFKRQKNF